MYLLRWQVLRVPSIKSHLTCAIRQVHLEFWAQNMCYRSSLLLLIFDHCWVASVTSADYSEPIARLKLFGLCNLCCLSQLNHGISIPFWFKRL